MYKLICQNQAYFYLSKWLYEATSFKCLQYVLGMYNFDHAVVYLIYIFRVFCESSCRLISKSLGWHDSITPRLKNEALLILEF